MNETFRNALRYHIQNTTLRPPRHRPSVYDALGTVLAMLLAIALMVLIGFS